MRFTTAAIISALSLASFTSAAPVLDERSGCSLYPWFIVPYHASNTCSSQPEYFQPTSGPYNPKASYYGCRPLSDPAGKPGSYQSVSINRDACPQQKWQIRLYTGEHCSGKPVVVNKDACVPAPSAHEGFKSFDAVLAKWE